MKSTLVGTSSTFVVVDAYFQIRYVSESSSERELMVTASGQLQPEIQAFLSTLSIECEDWSQVRAGLLSDDRVLSVTRVVGSDDTLLVITIGKHADDYRDCLERAARRHQLTRRETEILSLILDGLSACEIASMLSLSEHTVQGYFKRLLFKTDARNRVSMVAEVLDWDRNRMRSRDSKHIRDSEARVVLVPPAS